MEGEINPPDSEGPAAALAEFVVPAAGGAAGGALLGVLQGGDTVLQLADGAILLVNPAQLFLQRGLVGGAAQIGVVDRLANLPQQGVDVGLQIKNLHIELGNVHGLPGAFGGIPGRGARCLAHGQGGAPYPIQQLSHTFIHTGEPPFSAFRP